MMEKQVKLYVDCPTWEHPIRIDDFLVTVGKTKSNSVYHVAEVKSRPSPKHERLTRYHVKCFKSDLITAISRDNDQQLIPMQWYSRNKKTK